MTYRSRILAASAIATIIGVAALAGPARADVTVYVWGGYGHTASLGTVTPDQAADPNPSALDQAAAAFTYTGPINWVNNAANNGADPTQNLFGQFFDQTRIVGFASPGGEYASLSDFLDTSMSSLGNSWYSYIRVDGVTGAGTATITHDDGASVYSATCPGGVCYSWPTQVAETTGTFGIGAGPFTIDYIEANGSPSWLVFSVVPEPSTWAMMVMGFAGLGYAAFLKAGRTRVSALA